ncbi:MAG: hypothetical protein Q4C54_11090 [Clostridia bacterium]|nr:hypothetical protein [Clostridia bacterium]
MSVVMKEFHIDGKAVLFLDRRDDGYSKKVEIDGVKYDLLPITSVDENTIAIKCDSTLIGKEVRFIKG